VGYQVDKTRMKKIMVRGIRVLWVSLMFAALAFPCSAQIADSGDSSEYLIKAGFIFNFANLMQWPVNTFSNPDSPIVIGIVGTDTSGGILDEVLAGKKVNGRSFAVKHLKRGMDLKGCNIVFVSASETAHLDEILHLLKNMPILTIGETPSFAQRGGIINFIVVDDKIRFEVNVDAAKQADISISSRLLALAKIVPQADGSRVQ
jgi:hypothetical protein